MPQSIVFCPRKVNPEGQFFSSVNLICIEITLIATRKLTKRVGINDHYHDCALAFKIVYEVVPRRRRARS